MQPCIPAARRPPPPSYAATISPHSSRANIALSNPGAASSTARLQPWLGLRARAFLGLFPPAMASLLFVAIGVLNSMGDADRNVSSAKKGLMNACHDTERAAYGLVNTPHYFASSFNDTVARRMEDIVHGLARVLMLSITAVEKLLVFLVDLYRSLFLCFIELLVRCSLALLISAVDAISGALKDIAKALRTSIQGSIDGINATLKVTLGGLNDVLKLIGKSVTVPQIAMPDLSALDHVTLPDQIDGGLRQLNSSLPTLADLKQRMDDLISVPFEEMKAEVNQSVSSYSFDRSLLPVPTANNVSYCAEHMDVTPLDSIRDELNKAAKIGLGLLIGLAVLLILISVAMQWYSWRSLQRHVERTRTAFQLAYTDGDVGDEATAGAPARQEKAGVALQSHNDFMSFLQLSEHPFVADKTIRFAHRRGIRSESSLSRLRWWLAWNMHPIPLAILATGLVGLVGVQIQIIAIRAAERSAGNQANNLLSANANGLQDFVNAQLQATSYEYADTSNAIILQAQDHLNNDVFRWVNTTTSTMNNTLNEFMDGITEVLNVTFANTPLFTPVQSFINCIIGQKVAGIEKALTWIQNNSHVAFPLVQRDVLMISPNASQEALQPAQQKVLGGNDPNSSDRGYVGELADSYLRGLRRQRWMFAALILLYVALVAVGVLIAMLWGVENDQASLPWQARGAGDTDMAAAPYSFNNLPRDSAAFDDPAAKSGHRSISHPLLPEVFSQHRNRELAQEQERYQAFIRQHATGSLLMCPDGQPYSAPFDAYEEVHYTGTAELPWDQQQTVFANDQAPNRQHASVLLGEGYAGIPCVQPPSSRITSGTWSKLRRKSPTSSYEPSDVDTRQTVASEVLPALSVKSSHTSSRSARSWPRGMLASAPTCDTYSQSVEHASEAIAFTGQHGSTSSGDRYRVGFDLEETIGEVRLRRDPSISSLISPYIS